MTESAQEVANGVRWVDATDGAIPLDAIEYGVDTEEQLFVGRASHEGALLPGKIHPSHGVCYVAYGGIEYKKTEYQVLCGCNGSWQSVAEGEFPVNAIPGGLSEDGEPILIGRVRHEGTLTPGKVHPSHNACYVPYDGVELIYRECEILVQTTVEEDSQES